MFNTHSRIFFLGLICCSFALGKPSDVEFHTEKVKDENHRTLIYRRTNTRTHARTHNEVRWKYKYPALLFWDSMYSQLTQYLET